MSAAETMDPRLVAAVDLLGRTGAREFQLRYSDDDKPVVFMAVCRWHKAHEAAAALDPLVAILRLCDQVIDGGMCAHCMRPSGFDGELVADPMPLNDSICWYQFDPELAKFRRSCEGDT